MRSACDGPREARTGMSVVDVAWGTGVLTLEAATAVSSGRTTRSSLGTPRSSPLPRSGVTPREASRSTPFDGEQPDGGRKRE